jgi:acyl-CoA synthetase (AMP-forming)/AMP-acid ligase II
MLDHANVAAMCDMTQAGLGITAEDHSLLVLPLFHVNGIVVGTLSPLLAGGQVTVAGRSAPRRSSGSSSGSARPISRRCRRPTPC